MDRLTSTAIVLIGHGSRRGTYNEDIEIMVNDISNYVGIPVFLSYNEFNSPNWRDLINELIEKGYSKFIIGLVFLGRGNHIYNDIMGEMIGRPVEIEKWINITLNGKEISFYFTETLARSPLVRTALLYRLLKPLNLFSTAEFVENPEEIEERSLSLINQYLMEEDNRKKRIIAKAIFASGNPEIAKAIYIHEKAIDSTIEALRTGVAILSDVNMVKAGLRWKTDCLINDPKIIEVAKKEGITRAEASIIYGLKEQRLVVIGNSPTSILGLIKAIKMGAEVPAVIATPPGFTNAIEAKNALISSGIPSIVIRGTLGGSGIAVAIANEIVKMAGEKA
ncbi:MULTISPECIES: precorrin-8X methylmutase [Acidianus]|uniref:Precorrin-8X methylmutase n=1 Tax=Candidatus Acidianus copahuensis TaxID=1160895 RepID=A0A031LUA0_9CREN|nr:MULTISPECIES: precorrin-8X methylmutase [Acidianus]EZQ10703.1 precorrin-8X methylmutase [Candidatus Acidianus copahuensis]NON63242.1 precorrin-8X methylmutase [Acidianus sp. RZ1]